MRKTNQDGFSIFESFVIIAAILTLGFVIYHFGWGIKGQAGEKLLETDIDALQKAVGMYLLDSNGLYPTKDGKLPEKGEHKLIMWYATYTSGGRQMAFYPVILARLPRHWNEGVWRIDSEGRVSVTTSPGDY